MRPPALLTPDIEAVPSGEATTYRSRVALDSPAPDVGRLLTRWATEAPDRVLVADRDPEGAWASLTWSQAHRAAQSIAQGLLDRDLGPQRPLALLSGADLDHVLLTLGALLAGVPVVPVSEAYTTRSADLANLRHILELVRPGLVFAADRSGFARGAELAATLGAEVLTPADVEAMRQTPRPGTLPAIGPDAVAKVMFTSGSTDRPKGVLTTQRMLCFHAQVLTQIWPFVAQAPPVLVDWLPWNHCFGAHHNFGLVLGAGGTLHIDQGRPLPGAFETTVVNLKSVSPTVSFNVPAGFAQLVPRLERDLELRERYFARLQLVFNAGAALDASLHARLQALLDHHAPHAVLTAAWGATETGPLATSAHMADAPAGSIGVPVPGVEVKLAPVGDALELRVRGPNVTPGYLDAPEQTARAFDLDGFYRTGDAARLADPEDPAAGFVFDGRIAESFKLASGTFVKAGAVRVALVASCSPLVLDAVVCGHDRDEVGALVWLTDAGRDHPDLAATLGQRLAQLNAGASASTRVTRLRVLPTPPSLDDGEVTDKGYVNQRTCLRTRAQDIERLWLEGVITPARAAAASGHPGR